MSQTVDRNTGRNEFRINKKAGIKISRTGKIYSYGRCKSIYNIDVTDADKSSKCIC